MKKLMLLMSAVLLFTVIKQVNSQDFVNFPITKIKLSRNVILYKTGKTSVYTNMVAVKTSEGIVVIDALQYPEVAERVKEMIIKDLKGRISYLINTHGAYDHTGGNIVFEDIPIIGQLNVKTEIEMQSKANNNPQILQALEQQMIIKPDQMRSTYPGSPEEIDESIESARGMINSIKNNKFIGVIPDTLFKEKYTLKSGKTTFLMESNTPGYSRSDIIIYIPEYMILIVGDIFNKNRLPWFSPATDLEKWEKLFEPYIKEDAKVKYFLGAHGYPLTVDEIREQFKYLRKLYDEVKRFKTEGKTVDEVKVNLVLEKFPHLSNYNPYFYGSTIHIHNSNIDAIWRQLK
jgi:cyclase